MLAWLIQVISSNQPNSYTIANLLRFLHLFKPVHTSACNSFCMSFQHNYFTPGAINIYLLWLIHFRRKLSFKKKIESSGKEALPHYFICYDSHSAVWHSHLPFWEANTLTKQRTLFLVVTNVLLPPASKAFWEQVVSTNWGFNLLIHLQWYHLGLYTQTKKTRWTWPYAYWSLHRAIRVWSACWGIHNGGSYYARVGMKWTGYTCTSLICEQTESYTNRENFTRNRVF